MTLIQPNEFGFNAEGRNQPYLSVIIPLHNEAENLPECHKRLDLVLRKLPQPCEVIYIDDGSTDQSWEILQGLAAFYSNKVESPLIIRLFRFSRNFGKESAMTAGLRKAKGRASVILDADLQDPPELIPDMVSAWEEGYDVVDMQRSNRLGESFFKTLSAKLYYKLINYLADTPIPDNVGDFRLMDQRVVHEINNMNEATRCMKVIMAWPGFKRTTLQFERPGRFKGQSKWSYTALFGLAWNSICAFSIKPLRAITLIGLLMFLGGLTSCLSLMLFSAVVDLGAHGMYLMASFVLVVEGLQMLAVGVVAEYIAQLAIESKNRPLFIVQDNQEFWPQESELIRRNKPVCELLG